MSQSNFALASWKEKKTGPTENRDQERVTVDGWDASVFTDDVVALLTEVEDSSATGACLVAVNSNATKINENTELILTINTGQQKFARKAVVRWISNNNNKLRFGVQYIDHTQLDPDNHQLDVEAIRIDPSCALKIPSTCSSSQ